MNPTADHIAAAIVAACRETGDDPIRTAEGGLGAARPTNRARHYAMHALLHVFQSLPRHSAARLVGCPGSPAQFWNASWHVIVKPRGGLGHMALWFDDAALDRVIRAIEGVGEAPSPSPEPRWLEKLELPLPDQGEEAVAAPAATPPPYKPGPLPPAKPVRQGPGTLEPGGYRPPADTLRKALEDDVDRPVFDRGRISAGERKPYQQAILSKRQILEDFAKAVRNTAKLPTPPRSE